MNTDVVLQFIQVVGVPAAITFFVLWRLDARLVDLIKEIRTLHDRIAEVLAVNATRLSDLDQRQAHLLTSMDSLLREANLRGRARGDLE